MFFYINSFVFARVLPAESLLLKIHVYQRGLPLQRNQKELFVDTNIRLVLELFKLVYCEYAVSWYADCCGKYITHDNPKDLRKYACRVRFLVQRLRQDIIKQVKTFSKAGNSITRDYSRTRVGLYLLLIRKFVKFETRTEHERPHPKPDLNPRMKEK